MTATYPQPIAIRQTTAGPVAERWPPHLALSTRCIELLGSIATLEGDLLTVTAANGTATYELGPERRGFEFKGNPWRQGRLVKLVGA